MKTITSKHQKITSEHQKRLADTAKAIDIAMRINVTPMLKVVDSMKLNLPDMSALTALSERMQKSMPNMELIHQATKSMQLMPKIGFPPSLNEIRSNVFMNPQVRHRSTYQPKEISPKVINQNITININIRGNTIISRKLLKPKVSRWEEISLRFLNSHDIEINDGKNKQQLTFCDLGFMSKTTTNPKATWALLEKFAVNRGRIPYLIKKYHPNFKQELAMLRGDLRNFFGITEDPFENTRNGECRIKIDIAG